MKKRWFLLALLCMGIMSWCGNVGANPQGEDNGTAMTPADKPYSCEGILFQYDGIEYNIRELMPPINAIMSCVPAGDRIVLEGHINPWNKMFLVFNTETKKIEKEIEATNLIWRDDDIRTAVYTFGADICTYERKVLASMDLPEGAFIRDIAFADNNTKIEVSIFELPDNIQKVLVPIQDGAK